MYEDSVENNVWNHDFVTKTAKLLSQQVHNCVRGGQTRSSYNQETCKGELFKLFRVWFALHISEAQKNSEKLTFEISIWFKKLRNNFKKSMLTP